MATYHLATTKRHRELAEQIKDMRGFTTESQVWNRVLWEEAERLGLVKKMQEGSEDAVQSE